MTAEKNLDAVSKLAELNMKAMEEVTNRQTELVNYMIEQSKRQMELATQVRDFKEFAKAQTELGKETVQRLLEESKASIDTAAKFRDDYASFLKDG